MFCHNCGAPMTEDSQFCGKCGTPTPHMDQRPQESPLPSLSSILQGEQSGVPAAPQVPATGTTQILGQKKGRGRLPLVAIALVGVLAVGALAVAIVPAAVRAANPKLYLAGCAAKTFTTLASEVEKAGKSVGITPILEACATGKMEQSLSIGYQEFPSYMSGDSATELLLSTTIDVTMQTDIPDRKMSTTGGISMGSMDFLHFNLFADNNILSFQSPELTDKSFYALDTETMGRDLDKLTDGYSGVNPDLSFNLFDFYSAKEGGQGYSKETQRAVASLTEELMNELSVTKDGTQPVEINGSTEKLPQYTVTLPASAVRSYIKNSVRLYLKDDALRQSLELMLVSQGIYSASDVGAFTDTLEEEIEDAFSELKGDVTFTVSIRKGYLAKVLLSCEYMGVDCTADLQIGTAKSALDALSLVLEGDDGTSNIKLSLTSEGNHRGDKGSFSDQTRFTLSSNGETYLNLRSELSFDSKEKLDNFKWTLKLDEQGSLSGEIGAKGTVLVDKSGKKLDVTMDDLYMEQYDERFSLSGTYSAAPFQRFNAAPDKVKMLTDLDQDELYDLASDVEDRFEDLLYNLY